MAIMLGSPAVGQLAEVVRVLRDWQSDDAPLQLHPGDLGWFWRVGPEATATALRTWTRDGRIVAIGLLDEPTLLRLTTAPDTAHDDELARQLADDVSDPQCGVLPAGKVAVEAPSGARVHDRLAQRGWQIDEPWTPLQRNLAAPVEDPGVRIEVIRPERARVRTAVHRAAFDGSTFTDELWSTMADGAPYADARCLVAHDSYDAAVAAVTVWSAGPGRPGLLEPMGVHPDHRGAGYGRAICLAAASTLRDLGSSSAQVCTRSANVGGVATYRSAGFRALPERRDRYRDA